MFRNFRLAAVVVFVQAAGCTPPDEPGSASGDDAPQTTITGSLAYRERIALPPGSTAHVTLNDTSIADAAAPDVTSADIELGERQVPVPFKLTVPAVKLVPKRQYSVRATISGPDGRLLWTTDTAHTIDPAETSIDLGTLMLVQARPDGETPRDAGQGDPPELTARGNEPGWSLTVDRDNITVKWNYGENEAVVPSTEPIVTSDGRHYLSSTGEHNLKVEVIERVCRDSMSGMPHPHAVTVTVDGETLSGCGGLPAALLQGGEWVVEDIGGKGIVDNSRATLKFGADGSVTGRGSCNTYGATWKLSGEGLTVTEGRSTLMACSPALDNQEREFMRLLAAANRFDITDDGALLLVAGSGETITARRE
jgi:heat shock protein HslJ/uncharacterized lipoprotein YbaY